MFNSSIDFIEVGSTVFYAGEKCIVKENTKETVTLKTVNFNRTFKVPFYECNKIQNEEGVYF